MWRMRKKGDRLYLQSDDNGARLELKGGFPSEDHAIAFLERISSVLNDSVIYTEDTISVYHDPHALAFAKAEIKRGEP